MNATVLMGPVLHFRGIGEGRCRLAALLVTPRAQTPPALRADGVEIPAEALAGRLNRTLWRYTFSLPAQPGRYGTYSIGTETWRVHPPLGERLRFAYTACNGYETGDRLDARDRHRNERWRHLAAEHARAPFQLLIQGGDQVYADDVWLEVPQLAAWRKLNRRARREAPFSAETAAAVADYYFDRYCRVWGQAELAPIVASIPSLMMWDDHDIFDGWGSHSQALQRCPVFQGIGAIAREQFALFQLAARPEQLPAGFDEPGSGHFGWAFDISGIGVIAPDLRSERTRHQVMGEAGWRWLGRALEGLGHCRRVLFISTVPVLNVDLSLLERFALLLPNRPHFYLDDLRDQWLSYAHRQEWQRLVECLLDFSRHTRVPVTVLSGEIHLGALGVAEAGGTRFYQLTSSGIVHSPPPEPVARLYDWLSRGNRTLPAGIRMQMLPLPGLGRRYLAARNWLALDCAPEGTLQAQWHAEGQQGVIGITL